MADEKPIVGCKEDRVTIFQYNPSFAIVEARTPEGAPVPRYFVLYGLTRQAELGTLMLTSPQTAQIVRRAHGESGEGYKGFSVVSHSQKEIGVFEAMHGDRVVAARSRNGEIFFYNLADVTLTPPSSTVDIRLAEETKEALRFLYLTNGLDWDFVYNVSISGKTFDLSGEYVIKNNCGKTLDSVEVSLAKGKVVVKRAGRFYEELRRGVDSESIEEICMLQDFDETGLGKEESTVVREHMPSFRRAVHPTLDLVVDTLPERQTLEDQGVLTIPVLPFRNVGYKKEFVYDPAKFGHSVAITLSFLNTRANNLGLRLFPGEINFYVNSGREGFAKSALDYVYPGETGSIQIGSLSSIEVRDNSQTPEERDMHFKNFSDENKEVVVVEHLGRGRLDSATVNGKSIKVTPTSKREARIPLIVPASSEINLGYTIKSPGFLDRIMRRR